MRMSITYLLNMIRKMLHCCHYFSVLLSSYLCCPKFILFSACYLIFCIYSEVLGSNPNLNYFQFIVAGIGQKSHSNPRGRDKHVISTKSLPLIKLFNNKLFSFIDHVVLSYFNTGILKPQSIHYPIFKFALCSRNYPTQYCSQ